jgi:hypothetical protein
MNIIGCDLHTRYQVVAWVNKETGEILTLSVAKTLLQWGTTGHEISSE